MSVRSKLTMRCQIVPIIGQDEHGDVQYGKPVINVPCFVFGDIYRNRTSQTDENVSQFKILFLPSADVALHYRIHNVRSHKGDEVLKAAVVTGLEDNYHPKRGLVLRSATVKLGTPLEPASDIPIVPDINDNSSLEESFDLQTDP